MKKVLLTIGVLGLATLAYYQAGGHNLKAVRANDGGGGSVGGKTDGGSGSAGSKPEGGSSSTGRRADGGASSGGIGKHQTLDGGSGSTGG